MRYVWVGGHYTVFGGRVLRWKGWKRYKLVLFKCGTEMQPLCKMCVERQLGLPLKCLVKYPYGAVFELLSRLA